MLVNLYCSTKIYNIQFSIKLVIMIQYNSTKQLYKWDDNENENNSDFKYKPNNNSQLTTLV